MLIPLKEGLEEKKCDRFICDWGRGYPLTMKTIIFSQKDKSDPSGLKYGEKHNNF